MTNLIIASFSQEAQAIQGANKLSDLETLGDITIYEKVILRKNANGQADILQADTSDGLRTVSGMAIGSLIGALAGPVGLLAGMFTGTLVGAASEMDYYDFSESFGSKALDQLQPGMVAIVAEIDEDNPLFIDSSLTPLGATISRSDVDYEYEKYSDEQVEELDAEISRERAQLKSAVASDKAKIQKKIESLKEKRRKRINELKENAKNTVGQIKDSIEETKISRLKQKIERHQEKIAKLQDKLEKLQH